MKIKIKQTKLRKGYSFSNDISFSQREFDYVFGCLTLEQMSQDCTAIIINKEIREWFKILFNLEQNFLPLKEISITNKDAYQCLQNYFGKGQYIVQEVVEIKSDLKVVVNRIINVIFKQDRAMFDFLNGL